MFRDSKEYQEIAKIYAERVSKPENLDEMGPLGLVKGKTKITPFKDTSMGKGEKVKVTPFKDTSMGKGEKVKVTPFKDTSMGKPDGAKVDTSSEIESSSAEFKANEGDKVNQRFKKDVGIVRRSQMTGKERAQAIAKKRIESGKTIQQVKDENKASMRARAAEKNKKYQAAKKAGPEAMKKYREENPKLSGKERAQAMARERIAAKQRLKDGGITVGKEKPVTKQKPVTAEKPVTTEKPTTTSSETGNTTKKKLPSSIDIKPSGIFKDVGKSKPNDSGSNKRAEASKKRRSNDTSSLNVSSTKKNTQKNNSKFENNPSVKNFRKDVKDLKTTAKYGSTATIQTLDGKEYKPGDPGYEAELKKARSTMKKSMKKEEFTPYDIVLEYLLSTEQVATIEEANYVMTEMDAETIQGIVNEADYFGVPKNIRDANKRLSGPGPHSTKDKRDVLLYNAKKGKV